MKVLEIVQTHLSILGISSTEYPFNRRILFGFLLFGSCMVLHFTYIFCDATGFMDYVVSICLTLASAVIFATFATIHSKRVLLFDSIEKIEQFVDTSKMIMSSTLATSLSLNIIVGFQNGICSISGSEYPKSKIFFLKTQQQVERSSEKVFRIIMKILLKLFLLPKCVVSFVNYLITDSGCDSFDLPVPFW